MSRGRKLRTVLAVLGCIGLVVIAADIGTWAYYSRRVNRELEKLRSQGKPTTAAELAGDPIPDDQNAALVYLEIFSMISKPDGDIFARFMSTEERGQDPALWQQAEQAVERNKKAFALLAEAESRPHCRYPTNWEDGLRALFAYLADLRSFARALGSKAVVEAKAGDMDACVSSLRSSYLLAESIKEEPALIHFLTRLAVMGIAQDALFRASEYGTFNEDQARVLFDTLSRVDLRKGLVTALNGERAMGLSEFGGLRVRRVGLEELGSLSEGSMPLSSSWATICW